MNERIKELYTKALTEVGDDGEEAMVEKFAELIIRDCARIAAAYSEEGAEWDGGDAIREHFGVE